ncbi:MAG: hypothetical protein UV61_C0006G0027 [Candidatus Gottesmanbacteria bacterium GW2011_GWB1_43_11]|uniref:Uncharacterized protein n=1 Tax=Candidatus Gottesmanbacteria bacterium GW2011_GWB1_43_11 TaxID=1618446 RepID=A0A0G1EUW3_9BACT|nr:MAG: hypothetical protein UV04_C0005G0027 [Candidatus Gottesmanbacteria bacterium GW2011_GWA2_42_16]KKS55393.1 MAG: hypothetical protein UV17_C0011G0018 [Candidatus Gottesmanbacteria bacterium GW2011_GWA1_42_26]KKS81905.1 MAG: hypothetical protein UV55_C0007G0026 [Candidatus Gottesmanbacteria bacterium GW2011_GWC1_43_10]KKS86826.1 MAG: hypothetical protein UV61_C0006G0027 [Candidatus Gottesmanbacteria bacterium GW2011_GWB1_43_11]OGG10519.1 MAG: hypothetical protein A2699_04060 [Candidatus Go
MKRYLKVYRYLLKINFAKLVIYRTNFVSSLVSSLVWGIFIIVQMLLLTSRSTQIFGWTKNELLLLTGVFSVGVGLFHIFLTPNFENIAALVNFGRLDAWLLKPIDSQFLTSFMYVNFGAVTRLVAAMAFTIYILVQIQFKLTWVSSGVFLLFFGAGLLLIYSVWMSVVTLLIWVPRLSNIVEFMFSIMGMARFPREMFQRYSQVVLYILFPLTFVIVSPTKVLLAKATLFDAIGLFLLTTLFFIGSRKFWQFAMKYYTSASS